MRTYLRNLRIEKNMTQLEVAQGLDISESGYSLIESGDRQKKMSIEFADKLSKVLGVPIDTILKNEKGN